MSCSCTCFCITTGVLRHEQTPMGSDTEHKRKAIRRIRHLKICAKFGAAARRRQVAFLACMGSELLFLSTTFLETAPDCSQSTNRFNTTMKRIRCTESLP